MRLVTNVIYIIYIHTQIFATFNTITAVINRRKYSSTKYYTHCDMLCILHIYMCVLYNTLETCHAEKYVYLFLR